jgi:hypothetical protein
MKIPLLSNDQGAVAPTPVQISPLPLETVKEILRSIVEDEYQDFDPSDVQSLATEALVRREAERRLDEQNQALWSMTMPYLDIQYAGPPRDGNVVGEAVVWHSGVCTTGSWINPIAARLRDKLDAEVRARLDAFRPLPAASTHGGAR